MAVCDKTCSVGSADDLFHHPQHHVVRNRPEKFRKRLDNFVSATRNGRIISFYGGIGKYYGTQER